MTPRWAQRCARGSTPRGWSVRDTVSAVEALGLLDAEEFDVVLADVRMPGLDGIALCRKVRDRTPDVPVVLLTGFGTL